MKTPIICAALHVAGWPNCQPAQSAGAFALGWVDTSFASSTKHLEIVSQREAVMSAHNPPGPAESEQGILRLLSDPGVTRDQVLETLRRTPAGQRFVMKTEWADMARNEAISNWRRLAAYQVLIERVISYPCAQASFIADALLPLGIEERQLVDMSMASNVPVDRDSNTSVQMAVLPFPSALGGFALYFAVDRTSKLVRQAAIYPGLEEALP
jgi:hypothetical protein